MATNNEKHYMDKVASLPCSVCGTRPVELHHLREGRGMSQRASNYLVVPLCPECHRGSLGFHGDKTRMRILKLDELDLLARTIEVLNTVY